jgi:hypothetical protein
MPMEEHGFVDVTKLIHCGVYALVRKGEVVYVGKSKQPLMRIHRHVLNRGKLIKKSVNPEAGPTLNGKGINFDVVWFLPCMLGQLSTLENYFIRKFLPRHNVQGKPNPVMEIPLEIREMLKQMVTITGLPPLEDRPKVYIRRMF